MPTGVRSARGSDPGLGCDISASVVASSRCAGCRRVRRRCCRHRSCHQRSLCARQQVSCLSVPCSHWSLVPWVRPDAGDALAAERRSCRCARAQHLHAARPRCGGRRLVVVDEAGVGRRMAAPAIVGGRPNGLDDAGRSDRLRRGAQRTGGAIRRARPLSRRAAMSAAQRPATGGFPCCRSSSQSASSSNHRRLSSREAASSRCRSAWCRSCRSGR